MNYCLQKRFLAYDCCSNMISVVKGMEGSIECSVDSRTFSALELNLSCSRLTFAAT